MEETTKGLCEVAAEYLRGAPDGTVGGVPRRYRHACCYISVTCPIAVGEDTSHRLPVP